MDESLKNSLLIKTAKLYFEEGLSQADIAETIGYSRPYVSKLIAEAQERGIVTIKVHDSIQSESPIERKLRERFNLLHVFAIHTKLHESNQFRVAAFAANYLSNIVHSGDIIAVDSGNTIYRCARCLENQPHLDSICVVQMGGSFTDLTYPTYSQAIPNIMANAFNGVGVYYPVPVMIHDEHTRKTFLSEPSIAKVIELQKQANIAVFTVGSLSMGSSSNVVNSLFLSAMELNNLVKNGAHGEISGHFIDQDGNLCDPEFDKKILSLSLEELKKKKYRICMATGRAKYESIYAVLMGGYANILIVDDDAAKAVAIMSDRARNQ